MHKDLRNEIIIINTVYVLIYNDSIFDSLIVISPFKLIRTSGDVLLSMDH